jgi:hypothetical protein
MDTNEDPAASACWSRYKRKKERGISIQTNHIYNLIMQHNNKKVNLLGFRIYVTLV